MAGSRVAACVNVAVDTLKADAGVLAILTTAKVYTHVPQTTDAPYLMVLGGDEVPWAETWEVGSDSGDSGGRQVDVAVRCVSQYRGSAQVDDLADAVMTALIDRDAWSALSGFQLVQFVRNQSQPPSDLSSDGVMWFERVVTVRVTLA